MSKSLVEVRGKFSKFLNDNSHLNDTSRNIATAFFRTHQSTIPQENWDELAISGLVQMMGGLRLRRPPQTGSDQGVLALFDVDPIVVVRVVEDGDAVVEKNKSTLYLTLPEAMEYLSRHTKERETNTKKIREWRRLITRVKPFMTKADMTIEEGLIAAAASEKRGTRKGAE
jgi:hypothetical protein